MGKEYKKLLSERLKDKDFKKEYDKLIPEYEKIKQDLRKEKNKWKLDSLMLTVIIFQILLWWLYLEVVIILIIIINFVDLC